MLGRSGRGAVSVHIERRENVLILRIDREAKRNAIDEDISQGIERGLDVLHQDPGLRVGILTGGTTVFSAGTDLRVGRLARTERGGEYGMIRRRRQVPLIAAVEGPAFGGGMELALACDLVVASSSARFALPEAMRGIIATSGALFRGPRALPRNLATELLVCGGELGAQRAFDVGFVNRVSEPGGALDVALELARHVCRSSPVSVSETLHVLNGLDEQDDEVGWRLTEAAASRVRESSDYQEGVTAFFERREPAWTGQ